ncbi:hypothetical protein BRC88_10460 [Halobacteriales archaeon QS_4_69_225]|nr:MAG: hypothetical protein BRC88_10460 [Halobacteriales archaeon QS_4_69_225]
MKRYAFAAVVAFLAAAAVIGVAAADAGPLADAGLDQEVGVNTTVQLDGTGSSHPDGTIDGYEWSIETPAGARTTPACADCGRTNFRPTEPGRHNVTVVVTDSEGRSSTDTLYVYVRDFGPTVRLDGDTDPRTGERTPYEATVEANGSDLEELTWRIDGRTVDREAMSGQSSVAGRTFRFSGSGPYRLEAVAKDTTGRSDRDTLVVEPRPDSDPDPSDDGGTSSDSPDLPDIGETDDDTGGYVVEPSVSGGAVTIVSDDYTGDPPLAHGQVYDADSDDIPIPDGGNGRDIDRNDDKTDSIISGSDINSISGNSGDISNDLNSVSNGRHIGIVR